MPKKNGFSVSMVTPKNAEITIFGDIEEGWGIGPSIVKDQLDAIKGAEQITLYINSVGGSVNDGMAIYQLLKMMRDKLDVVVLGMAASIASVIALAGRSLKMAKESWYMIHRPQGAAFGLSDDLRKIADLMDSMESQFIDIYSEKSGKDKTEIEAMMEKETWLDANGSVEFGFADEIVEYGEMAAKATIDPEQYTFAHIPEALIAKGEEIHTEREFETYLRDSGAPRNIAVAIVSNAKKVFAQGEPVADTVQRDSAPIAKIDQFGVREKELDIDMRIMGL